MARDDIIILNRDADPTPRPRRLRREFELAARPALVVRTLDEFLAHDYSSRPRRQDGDQ